MTSHKIEDYALLGDTRTAALVSKDGSMDWLCAPRFDSPACFAGLLGSADNGRWLLAPTALSHVIKRRYREDTLVLETDYETDTGSVRMIDTMSPVPADETVTIVRIAEGRSGRVSMSMELGCNVKKPRPPHSFGIPGSRVPAGVTRRTNRTVWPLTSSA
jgi:hypothetical protein